MSHQKWLVKGVAKIFLTKKGPFTKPYSLQIQIFMNVENCIPLQRWKKTYKKFSLTSSYYFFSQKEAKIFDTFYNAVFISEKMNCRL
jgi:hypothetical protein